MVESIRSEMLIWSVLFPSKNSGAPYTAPLVNSRKSEPQQGDFPESVETHYAYLSTPLLHGD